MHTHLIVDSTRATGRTLHEINVIGTMNLLAAAGCAREPGAQGRREELGARVRRQLPGPERVPRRHDAHASRRAPRVERSLLEVEAFLRDFADDNPHVDVTLLRFANVLGDDLDTPFAHALRRRVVPEIFGFDPRVQFVHDDDVVGALMYATTHDVPGVYNVAGDGNLPWSEVCAILGKRRARAAAGAHRRGPPSRCGSCGMWDLPPEALMLLRYGRTIDNTRYKRAGFRYQYTSAGTVEAFAQGLRLAGAVGDTNPSYRYERDVENFFRHSPAVVRPEQG